MLNFFAIIFAVVFVAVPVLIFALTLFYMIREIIHNGTSLKLKGVSELGAFIFPEPIEFYKVRLKSNCFLQCAYYINKPFCHRQV